MRLFKADTMDNFGENWMVANFGKDYDDKEHIVTTDCVKCSEYACITRGAKGDAELVAELLNAYHNGLIPEYIIKKDPNQMELFEVG